MELAFNKDTLFRDVIPLTWTQPSINANHPKQVESFVKELLQLHEKGRTMEALQNAEEKLQSTDPAVRMEGLKKALNIEQRALKEYIKSANQTKE